MNARYDVLRMGSKATGSFGVLDYLAMNRGMTLAEVAVVLGIIAISAGIAVFASEDMLRGTDFRDDRDSLVMLLVRARAESMNHICRVAGCTAAAAHGVEVLPGEFVLFEGDGYATRVQSEDVSLGYGSDISMSGAHEIIFESGSGDVLAPGTISISDATGHTSSIIVGDEGRISWSN